MSGIAIGIDDVRSDKARAPGDKYLHRKARLT
jgi:hypothetical protein